MRRKQLCVESRRHQAVDVLIDFVLTPKKNLNALFIQELKRVDYSNRCRVYCQLKPLTIIIGNSAITVMVSVGSRGFEESKIVQLRTESIEGECDHIMAARMAGESGEDRKI